jgi:hypothetical protein
MAIIRIFNFFSPFEILLAALGVSITSKIVWNHAAGRMSSMLNLCRERQDAALAAQ